MVAEDRDLLVRPVVVRLLFLCALDLLLALLLGQQTVQGHRGVERTEHLGREAREAKLLQVRVEVLHRASRVKRGSGQVG